MSKYNKSSDFRDSRRDRRYSEEHDKKHFDFLEGINTDFLNEGYRDRGSDDRYYLQCSEKFPCGCVIEVVGPTGTCECQSIGEQVVNGGMELFTDDIPTDWTTTTPNVVSQVTQQGRVHSGNSSVNLEDGAKLSQSILTINGGCFYELSFFAHGEGARVGLTATVTFATPTGNVNGAIILVRQRDIPTTNRVFAHYRVLTSVAPLNVTSAIISFEVTANGEQSLDLDDVSFAVN